jgi:dTMP kinase
MPTGVFLSLDGLDGTGKSTQHRLLVDRLRGLGVPVTACVDPGGTPLGSRIRELLLHRREVRIDPRAQAALFMASRAQLVDEILLPAISRDEVIVCDRYLLATVVYQGHACRSGEGISPDELWQIGEAFTTGLHPDLTLVFDLPPEVAAARRQRPADRMESQPDEYFRRVREGFLTEARRWPQTHVVIDATPPVEAVHEAVWRAVTPLLVARGHLTQG